MLATVRNALPWGLAGLPLTGGPTLDPGDERPVGADTADNVDNPRQVCGVAVEIAWIQGVGVGHDNGHRGGRVVDEVAAQ